MRSSALEPRHERSSEPLGDDRLGFRVLGVVGLWGFRGFRGFRVLGF